MSNLLNQCKVTRSNNAAAAGSADANGAVIDTQGAEGVMWCAMFGTLTATQVTALHAQQDTVVGFGGAADLLGSSVGPMADGDSNKMLILDLYRPRERFVRLVIDRATANAVIDGAVAILYGLRVMPKAADSTVSAQKVVVSPAEGTP